MKIAFMDRDGTICKDYVDSEWTNIKSPVFVSGSIEIMRSLIKSGFKIIIVTNQYLIDEGFIKQIDYNLFTEKLISILKQNDIEILNIYHCPHKRSFECSCSKPKQGLIDMALIEFPMIDLENSIYIGNSTEDEMLAKIKNIKFYGIDIDNVFKHPEFYSDYSQLLQKLVKEGMVYE